MRIYPVVVGDLSGTMDRTVFYKVDNRCYGRKKALGSAREYTEEELKQQLKFKFMGKLSSRTKYVLRESLPETPKHWTAPNYFVSLNIGLCEADLETSTVTFDYNQAVFAAGSMSQPSVTMSYDDESRTVSFTLPAMSGRAFPGKQATDKVYAVFVESELMQAYTVELGTRGDGGMTSEPLEEGWNKETTHVYVYATDEKGKETSTSRHLSFE